MSKISLFEYFLKRLVEWYCEHYAIASSEFNDHHRNDLSKLKIIKLHFFACSTNNDALDVFDAFHAMPYGHVESEVYNRLTNLRYCQISSTKLGIIDLERFMSLQPDNSSMIDIIVESLKKENADLITMEPFDLVELSHKWFSWRYNFQKARQDGMYSKPISKDLIIREEKFYSLF